MTIYLHAFTFEAGALYLGAFPFGTPTAASVGAVKTEVSRHTFMNTVTVVSSTAKNTSTVLVAPARTWILAQLAKIPVLALTVTLS